MENWTGTLCCYWRCHILHCIVTCSHNILSVRETDAFVLFRQACFMSAKMFPKCSHNVPTMFPQCFHNVPTLFPQCTFSQGVKGACAVQPSMYCVCKHVCTTFKQCTFSQGVICVCAVWASMCCVCKNVHTVLQQCTFVESYVFVLL